MSTTPLQYWEQRALQYAGRGSGLAAVCSYGMPSFYNLAIHCTQRLALRPWTNVGPGDDVLDVGCGVGRWSVRLAQRGADVTGVDLSQAMLAEAEKRAHQAGVEARCRFAQQDLATLEMGRRFRLIVGVTVLQHIMDPARLDAAIGRLAHHLHPQGRLVLLEAAPNAANDRCDTPIFRARRSDEYLQRFNAHGLQLAAVSGVDPAPFRILLLPYYRRLPRPIALLGLAAATACSFPVDALAGRRLTAASWHKVFVLRHPPGSMRA